MKNENLQSFSKLSSSKNVFDVQNLFSDVALNYDLMNDLMSFGAHRLWKKKLVSFVRNFDSKILDIACGTGDISLYLATRALKFNSFPQIYACDLNQDMLSIAKDRMFDHNIHNVSFSCENAQRSSFSERYFDYYLISFGIRNCCSVKDALKEAYRVLKPQGHFLCLEFFKYENKFLKKLYQKYLFYVIPQLGGLISDKSYAYRYLAETIEGFLTKSEFNYNLFEAGFVNVESIDLGVATIFHGYKA